MLNEVIWTEYFYLAYFNPVIVLWLATEQVIFLGIPFLGPIHTKTWTFSFENAYFLLRVRLSSTLIRPKTPMKTETFEKQFQKCTLLKTLRFKCGQVETRDFWKRWRKKCRMPSVPDQIGGSIQDGLVTLFTLTRAQSQVPAVFIVFESFSVDRWKRLENASVDVFLKTAKAVNEDPACLYVGSHWRSNQPNLKNRRWEVQRLLQSWHNVICKYYMYWM